MSEDLTGPSTNPAGQPQNPPAAPPAPPAAPDPGTPPAAPAVPPPSHQIDQDNLARRFDTERGKWQQYASEIAGWQGTMQQQLASVRTALNDRIARVAQLETENAALKEQLQAVPGLKEQASKAAVTEQQLNKLKAITAYPEIVTRVQEQEVQRDDGTMETVRVNPILDMLMNSALDGDEFNRNLRGVVATLTNAPTLSSQVPPTTGMTPTPAAASADDEFWAQYNEAQNRGDWSKASELLQDWAAKQDQARSK